MSHIEVTGSSVAAAAVSCLLQRAGLTVKREDTPAARVPAVMLGSATRKLWSDVFEPATDPFADLWRIERRRVRWGNAPETVLPHQAWVLTSGEATARLHAVPASGPVSGDAAWRIQAGGLAEIPPTSTSRAFGSRQACALRVALRTGVDARTCIAESLARGWLFLLPISPTEGWLLITGDLDSDSALAGSRLAVNVIDHCEPGSAVFECHPRLTTPVAATGWLCCGSAAAGFDPLCGDGVGNALREAILASAVVELAQRDPKLAELAAAHYERQLRGAMFRHLRICESYYATGGEGAWWTEQRESARTGAEWLASWLQATPPAPFRLHGFALEPLAS